MTTTIQHWWTTTGSTSDSEPIEPIPFPSKRARMMIGPPHVQSVRDENRSAASNVNATLAALTQACRRMDVLARELDCLWYYSDDDGLDDHEPPSAA